MRSPTSGNIIGIPRLSIGNRRTEYCLGKYYIRKIKNETSRRKHNDRYAGTRLRKYRNRNSETTETSPRK